jgi:hypothetical protein
VSGIISWGWLLSQVLLLAVITRTISLETAAPFAATSSD